ncbi:MAG: LytR/AlgR family response regulator transcription factor [Prolixibacteraceae bacterium]
MNLKQSVPDYLSNKKNTIIQIGFTTIFAYIFINIYRPFGYNNWYKIKDWQLLMASALVVIAGMIVIMVSRLILFRLKKSHEITIALYIWFIVAEIFFLGLFYTTLEIVVLKDNRSAWSLLFNAVQNTALILLIPYTLSFLFFAWSDIKKKLEHVVVQFRDPSEIFIPFNDEKGSLKITIKSINVLFLESNDNYVNIHYNDNGKRKIYMIRSSLKQFETELKDYSICRTHRKYSVNIKNIKMLKKERKGFEVIINTANEDHIPVSKSYEQQIIQLLSSK